MPRRIEKRQRGTKDSWTLAPEWCAPGNIASDHEWRYVGGVLEYGSDRGGWAPIQEQAPTIAERSKSQGYPTSEYRLRPYDDAPATVVARAHLGHTHRGRCGGCGEDYVVQSPSQVVSYQCGTCNFENRVGGDCAHNWRPLNSGREECFRCRVIRDAPVPAPVSPALQAEQQKQHAGRAQRVGTEAEIAMRTLEVKLAEAEGSAAGYQKLSSQRGDELGTARTRITELEAECFRLRKRAEDAERKAKVRR